MPAALGAVVLALLSSCGGSEPAAPPGSCGGGTWREGTLEIHHLSLGQADATIVVAPSGRTMLVDAGERGWQEAEGAVAIGQYLRRLCGGLHLDLVVVTHFHLDHVGAVGWGGLWHLAEVQGAVIGRTLHRDLRRFVGQRGRTWEGWRGYLDGPGRARLRPALARVGLLPDLGPAMTLEVVAVDGAGTLLPGDRSRVPSPPNENDYSVALRLRFGAFDYFTGGDLSGAHARSEHGYAYHDVETAVAPLVGDVDVYRVNHHGSEHASNPVFLAQLAPEVSIVSAGRGNAHGHPHSSTLGRLRARGEVLSTIGGPVVVRSTDGWSYEVEGQRFRASDPARVDADGDGYFREADPDDGARERGPPPRGGCDPLHQACL